MGKNVWVLKVGDIYQKTANASLKFFISFFNDWNWWVVFRTSKKNFSAFEKMYLHSSLVWTWWTLKMKVKWSFLKYNSFDITKSGKFAVELIFQLSFSTSLKVLQNHRKISNFEKFTKWWFFSESTPPSFQKASLTKLGGAKYPGGSRVSC